MDPVTIVVIGAIAIVTVPKVGKLGIYGAVKLGSKIKKSLKERKAYKLRHNEKYQAKLENSREAERAIEQRRSVPFQNTKTGAVKNVKINEINTFDLDKDVILKGTVYVANPNGGDPAQDTIYLFPPRVYGANNVPIGPKLDKNGHLYDDNSYLLRTSGDPDIYKGYVPKREVISNRKFDYVNDSANAQKDELSNFLKIEIPKDADGHYIPLDKNNAKEMQEFRNYVQLRQEQNVNQNSYLDELLAKAKLSWKNYLEANKPRYAKATEEQSPEEIEKEQKNLANRAEAEAKKDAYYDQIDRMKMADSIRRNYGQPAPLGGPSRGMPMGPGPGGAMGQPSQGGPTPGGKRR